MNVVSLENILIESDLNQIPPNLRAQINCVLESKCKSLDSEKQRIQLLEKELSDLEIKYNYTSDSINAYKNHIAGLENDLYKSRKELCESNHSKDCLNVEIKNLELEIDSKIGQINRFNELLNTKNDDITELIEKNRRLQIELTQLRESNKQTTQEDDEKRFSNILIEKDKLNELELNFLKDELKRVTNEYHEKSTKLNSLTSEFKIYQNDKEIKLNDLGKEINTLKNQIQLSNNLIEKKDNQINELANKVKELHHHQELLNEQYNIEKKEYNDLVNYYKKIINDNKNLQQELVNKLKELEKEYQDSVEFYSNNKSELENNNNLLKNELAKREELNLQLEDKIIELENKIINLTDKQFDSALQQFYPTSKAVSKLFEKNMPLSTVYTKYEELQKECDNLVSENDELKSRLREMIDESDKNAPLLYYKTQENKKALVEIENHKMQLTKISSDLAKALVEIDNYNKMNNYLKRELQRYEKSNIDLTRQVRSLLQTVHECRGNFISTKFLVDDHHLNNESELNKSVSLDLVTFKNIEEMHENNKKLLIDIRELIDQNEELRLKCHEKGDQQFKDQIDNLLVEIENLKEENRHKQEILSELLADNESKQNTSLNKLDNSMKDKHGSTQTLFKITSRAYLEEKIVELSNNLDNKIEEFGQFKRQVKEEDEKLKNEIAQNQKQISNYQSEISKLTVKLDTLNENNKVLDSTLTRYNKDIGLLKERNIKLEEQRKTLKERIGTFESKKNELIEKLNQMKNDLDTKTKLINVLEKDNDHVKLENKIMKSRIEELKSELKMNNEELTKFKTDFHVNSVKSEMELKNKVQLLELQNETLKNNLQLYVNEKNDLDNKNKVMKSTINDLRGQIITAAQEKTKCENEKEQIKNQIKEYQDRLNEIEQSTDDQNNKRLMKVHLELKNQLDEKNKMIEHLKLENKRLSELLKKNEFELGKAIKSKTEIERTIAERMKNFKKDHDEKMLRDKILKNKIEKELKLKNDETNKLKEELLKLKTECDEANKSKEELLKLKLLMQQQQQQKTYFEAATSKLITTQNQQHQQPNQSTSSTTPNKPSVITAKINPLTVINRTSIQSTSSTQSTIPQATIPPTQQTTPQTAYVMPTNVEISSADNINNSISSSTTSSSSMPSFALPSTSTNLSTSTANNQDNSFLPARPSTQVKKRPITSIEDYNNLKKQKANESIMNVSDSTTTSRTSQEQMMNLFSNTNQNEQACTSSSVNDQEMQCGSHVVEEESTSNKQQPTQTITKQEKEIKNQEQQEPVTETRNVEIENQEADGNSLGLETNIVESQQHKENESQQQSQQQTSNSPTSNQIITEDNNENMEDDEEEDDDNNEDDEEDDDNNQDNSILSEEDDEQYDDEYVENDEEENSEIDEEDFENEDSMQINQDSNQLSRNDNDEVICLSDEDDEDDNSNDDEQLGHQVDQRFAEPNEEEMDTFNRDNEESNYIQQQQELLQQQQQEFEMGSVEGNAAAINLYESAYLNPNYPDSANMNQLDDRAATSNQDLSNQSQIPILTEMDKVEPVFLVKTDSGVDYSNLEIDEQSQQQIQIEQQQIQIEQQQIQIEQQQTGTEITDSNSSTSNFIIDQQQQQASTNLPSLIKFEENSNIQNKSIDQKPSASNAPTEKQQQSKKSKLKRPQISLLPKKDNQDQKE